jgi:membrane fusion protein (multidrug efflux system)
MPEGTVPSTQGLSAARRPFLSSRRIALALGVIVLGAAAFATKTILSARTVTTDDALVIARTVAVAPEVSAKVLEVRVREHARVNKGDVLVELDRELYEIGLARAEGELHAAEAQQKLADVRLASVKTQRPMLVAAARGDHVEAIGLRQSLEGEVKRSEEALAASSTALALARQEYSRALALQKSGSVSAVDVDHAAARVAALEAEQRSAAAQIAVAKSRRVAAGGAEASASGRVSLAEVNAEGAAADADRALAGARVEQARSAVRRAEAELGRTRIVAPISGVVEHLTVESGMLVGPPSAVLSIVSTEDVWIEARIKETSVARVHEGQTAVVSVDALDREISGRVEGVGAATLSRFALVPAETTGAHFVRVTQRVPVLVRLDAKPEGLRAGLSAVVTVRTP